MNSNANTAASLILRVGLAFAFVYPPLNAIGNPDSWIGYFPHFMLAAAQSMGVPNLILLHGFGLIEVVIALWVLSGWRIFWPSIAAALLLVSIVFFDFSNFEVVFRDLSITAIALSLAVQNLPSFFTKQNVADHVV